MLVRTLRIIVLVALFASAAVAQASGMRVAPHDPQLDALVAEALAHAPEIAAGEAYVEAARRRIAPARTLADPFISTTYQNDGRAFSLGSREGSFLGLMVTQPLPWPGKLRLAGDAAESEVRELEQGSVGRTRLTLEARVRNAWYDLVLARAIDRTIEDRRRAVSQIEASVRERYAAGLAVQQDVLRAQVELALLDEQKAGQAAVIASRQAELNALTGAPHDRLITTPDSLPYDAAPQPPEAMLAAAAARSPELAAARQGIRTGNIGVARAARNVLPDFSVSAGSMARGNFEMGPMWQVGVGVSLPLWIDRRQHNQLAEAEAIVRGRTADSEVVVRELELRTRERIAQRDAALRIAALYREKVLPLDELALESALASYGAGKVPFITVVAALDALYRDRAACAGQLAASAKWRVAIDEASLQPAAMSARPMDRSPMAAAGGAPVPASAPPVATTPMNSMR